MFQFQLYPTQNVGHTNDVERQRQHQQPIFFFSSAVAFHFQSQCRTLAANGRRPASVTAAIEQTHTKKKTRSDTKINDDEICRGSKSTGDLRRITISLPIGFSKWRFENAKPDLVRRWSSARYTGERFTYTLPPIAQHRRRHFNQLNRVSTNFLFRLQHWLSLGPFGWLAAWLSVANGNWCSVDTASQIARNWQTHKAANAIQWALRSSQCCLGKAFFFYFQIERFNYLSTKSILFGDKIISLQMCFDWCSVVAVRSSAVAAVSDRVSKCSLHRPLNR